MNKRIKELADQALKECDAAKERGIDQYSKRFAELIVRECVGCCNIIAKVEWIEPPTYELGIDACKLKIKQHFGVK